MTTLLACIGQDKEMLNEEDVLFMVKFVPSVIACVSNSSTSVELVVVEYDGSCRFFFTSLEALIC